jgi:transposase
MSTLAPPATTVATHDVPLPTLEQLPDDLPTLKGMILELALTLRQERLDKEALRHRVALLVERLYGQRTERFRADQPLLFGDAGPDADPGQTTAPTSSPADAERPRRRRRSRPHGRRQLPANLPRRPVHHELSAAERLCSCGQFRLDIGVDVSEQLDWQPACYFVWQHLTHKYACPHCSDSRAENPMTTPDPAAVDPAASTAAQADLVQADLVQADLVQADLAASAAAVEPPTHLPAPGPAVIAAVKPAMPIAKGLPGPGLLAHIVVSKYADHQPLYRQEGISKRQGVFIPRSTSCDWMAACAELLRPLYDLMVAAVLESLWLHTDDTPVKNLGHEPGSTATARFWLYYGDRTHPYNVFDFTVNRRRDGPQTFLTPFQGYLHADAFSGYDALYLPSAAAGTTPIKEVACNAHARRKFYEARGSDDLRAHQALSYYGQLYELERAATAAGLDDAGRGQMRQELSRVILDKFHAWLKEQRAQVLPKSPLAEAIGYALNNWTALCRYTEAGFLSIDNNVAEREMKRIAIGRKNWLFVGSAKGGHTAAVLFSFTSTCHRLGIDPWAYLQDVFTHLPRLGGAGLAALLPDRWQAARQQSPQSLGNHTAPSAPASASPS